MKSGKAHPISLAILLQVMDHATLTDTHGRHADFRHVILIMTTNAGARDLSGRKMGFKEIAQDSKSTGVLERVFAPEFRNRLDAIVHFTALGTREIERVVDKHIDELRQLVAGRTITIELTPAARPARDQGIRSRLRRTPMGRLVGKTIRNRFGFVPFGTVNDGDRVLVDVHEEPPGDTT